MLLIICASSDDTYLDQTITALNFGSRCLVNTPMETCRSNKSTASGRGNGHTQCDATDHEQPRKRDSPTLARDIRGLSARSSSDDGMGSSHQQRAKWFGEWGPEDDKYGMGRVSTAATKKKKAPSCGGAVSNRMVAPIATGKAGSGAELQAHDLSGLSSEEESKHQGNEKRNRPSLSIPNPKTAGPRKGRTSKKEAEDVMPSWLAVDSVRGPPRPSSAHGTRKEGHGPLPHDMYDERESDPDLDLQDAGVKTQGATQHTSADAQRGTRKGAKASAMSTTTESSIDGEQGDRGEGIPVYSPVRAESASTEASLRVDVLDEASPRSIDKNRLSAKDLTLIDYAQRLEVYEEVAA
jgi:hypothetical protein